MGQAKVVHDLLRFIASIYSNDMFSLINLRIKITNGRAIFTYRYMSDDDVFMKCYVLGMKTIMPHYVTHLISIGLLILE